VGSASSVPHVAVNYSNLDVAHEFYQLPSAN
jgi:hypothetical protein